MTEKLLSKMLPRNAVISGEGRGGKAHITGYDVAAALAYGSLPKPAYYLGRAKYCSDKAAESMLLKHLEIKIHRIIKQRKWHNTKNRAKGLAWLVLHEGVYGISCKNCDGRGFIWKSKGKKCLDWGKACYYCNSTGLGQLSDSKRSSIAQISKTNWSKTWKARNEKFIQYASDLEYKVLRHLYNQFYRTTESP